MTLDIYKENILDLYKHPLNKGELKNPTHEYTKNNPLCGDEITMQLLITENKIKDVKFSGNACAISMAAASMLTEKIKHMSVDDVKKLNKDDILDLIKIPLSSVRLKCALLSLDVVKGALENES